MCYLKSAFDTYQKVQDAVQSRLGEVQSRHSPMEMMKKFLDAPPSSQPRAQTEPELDGLSQRVAELKARLAWRPAIAPTAYPNGRHDYRARGAFHHATPASPLGIARRAEERC